MRRRNGRRRRTDGGAPWMRRTRRRRVERSDILASLCAGAHRNRDRHPAGAFLSGYRRGDEAARRRLHQADQDADRADHLLHCGARHCQHGGHEEGRPGWPKGADLFRDRDDAGADRRPDRRQYPAARRRHERGCAHDRYQIDPGLHDQGRAAGHGRIPDAHHSQYGRRRVRRGRDPAGPLLRHPVCIRFVHARRTRSAGSGPDRHRLARVLRHRRHHHEGSADRRVRRDGIHDRKVWRGNAAVARRS